MKRIATAIAFSFLFASAARAADGKETFATKCTVCHGADGKGQNVMGKKLGVKDLSVTKLSEADIETTVNHGKGKMPAFGSRLSAGEIKAVAGFVKGGLK